MRISTKMEGSHLKIEEVGVILTWSTRNLVSIILFSQKNKSSVIQVVSYFQKKKFLQIFWRIFFLFLGRQIPE